MTPPQEIDIKIRQIPWDRMFCRSAFGGARLFRRGLSRRRDLDGFRRRAWRSTGTTRTRRTCSTRRSARAPCDTYDDKPKFACGRTGSASASASADLAAARRGVVFRRVHQGRHPQGRPVALRGPTQGESDCELIFQSAYVNRDNKRYGLVREMISLQDEINKRRSKALHCSTPRRSIYEDGAVDDIETFRREAARPDGTMKVNVRARCRTARLEDSDTRTDLADGAVPAAAGGQERDRPEGPERHRDGRQGAAAPMPPRAGRSSPASRAA